MTFAELKHAMLKIAAPTGYARGYDVHWNQYAVEALRDLQLWVPCLQRNLIDMVPHCSTMYKCGTSALPKPDGKVLAVGTVATRTPEVQPSTPFETGAQLRHWSYLFHDMLRPNRTDAHVIFRAKLEFQIGVRILFKHTVAVPAVPPTWPDIRYKGAVYYISAIPSDNSHWHPKLLRNVAKQSFDVRVAANREEAFDVIIPSNSSTIVWWELEEISGPIYEPVVLYGADIYVYGPPYSANPAMLTMHTEWCGYVPYQYVPSMLFQQWYNAVGRQNVERGICLGDFFHLNMSVAGRKAFEAVPRSDLALDIAASGDALPMGFLRPTRIPDSAMGRSLSGVWTVHNNLILLAPWVQSYESVVVHWTGNKNYWNDQDWIPDDPTLVRACAMWASYRWNLVQRRDADAAAVALREYNEVRARLMYECLDRALPANDFDLASTVASVYGVARPELDARKEIKITHMDSRTAPIDERVPRIIATDTGAIDPSEPGTPPGTGTPPLPPPPPPIPRDSEPGTHTMVPSSPPPVVPRRGGGGILVGVGSRGSSDTVLGSDGGTGTTETGGTGPGGSTGGGGAGGAGSGGVGTGTGGIGGGTGGPGAGDGGVGGSGTSAEDQDRMFNSDRIDITLCCEDIGCVKKEGKRNCARIELPSGYARGRTKDEANATAFRLGMTFLINDLTQMCACGISNAHQKCKKCCPGHPDILEVDYESPAIKTCAEGESPPGEIKAEDERDANERAQELACERATRKLKEKKCTYCNDMHCMTVWCYLDPNISQTWIVPAGTYCVDAVPSKEGSSISVEDAYTAKMKANELAIHELARHMEQFDCGALGPVRHAGGRGNVCID